MVVVGQKAQLRHHTDFLRRPDAQHHCILQFGVELEEHLCYNIGPAQVLVQVPVQVPVQVLAQAPVQVQAKVHAV